MQGHEGFIAIYQDVDWNGTSHSFPQLLYADSEEFSVGKDIKQKPFQVGNGRVKGTGGIVSGPIKPEGGITYQFRSDDCLKVFMSHFQMGTSFETGSSDGTSFQYGFYPTKKTPNYMMNSGYGEGSYNSEPGYVYSVSFLKKYMETSQYGGTNSIFFRHGICDNLKVSLSAERDARLTANYKFRDLDYGTAVASGTVGSYSSNNSFIGWSATVLVGGQTLDISSMDFTSDNAVEEKTRVGRLSPDSFSFGEYSLKGAFKLDLPKDALRFVGSMFTLQPFTVLATLYNGANDQVVLDLPHCKYLPFNFNISGGNEEVSGVIPFQAFAVGNYPIRVTVNSNQDFEGLSLIMDATDGARTVSDHEEMDAGTGARTLSEYEILDRDA